LSTSGAPSDETLARRVQLGCVRSYEELDRRLRPRLVYLLRKRTGSREDAEDLTQQALMRAYEKIDQYNPARSFRSWLFTIAVRLAIDAHRRRGVASTGGGIDRATDPGPGPHERVDQMDTQRRLWALADRVLDPTQRTALWLHYGEQLKAGEIARTLGITSVHVRVLLYRARRTLLMHLEEPEPVRLAERRSVETPAPRRTQRPVAVSGRMSLSRGAVR
jgi:RNA polymerase sigma-70 factor (ECF subfamily)